jgi:hypothetical protein
MPRWRNPLQEQGRMKLVKILKPWSVYNPGEQAGFEDATADKLVKAGIAEMAEAAAAAEAGGADTSEPPKTEAKAEGKPADKRAAAAAALPGQGAGSDTPPAKG